MQTTKYFKTYLEAEQVSKTLPPFKPSQFLSKFEIENGCAEVKITEFGKGFAIQLGDCGNFYPNLDNVNWQDITA